MLATDAVAVIVPPSQPLAGSPYDRIPADIRSALSRSQTDRLVELMGEHGLSHGFAYQISTRILHKRFYLAIFAGPDRRSLERIRAAGENRSVIGLVIKAILLIWSVSGLLLGMAFAGICVVYLIKVALGIDLMEGNSFLHDLLLR